MQGNTLLHGVVFGVLTGIANVCVADPCTLPGSIMSVKNTSPAGSYEYVEFDIKSPPTHTYTVTSVKPPFFADPSGDPISVAGKKFKQIVFTSVEWMCSINNVFTLPKLQIKGIKQADQSEGVISYIIGYKAEKNYVTTQQSSVGSITKVVMKFKK
jgi:hypothetical protein